MVCFIWFWRQTTAVVFGYVTKYENASSLSGHFVVWMLIYFCVATEQHWKRNRIECVFGVRCLVFKKVRWKIKSLTNNNNNNNKLKLFIINWSSIDGCRCHHFDVHLLRSFFVFLFFIFYSPHGDMKTKMNAITTTLNRNANMNFNVNRILNCGTRFSLFIPFEHRTLGMVQFISCVHHLMLPIN